MVSTGSVLRLAGRHRDVEVDRVGGDAVDRAGLAPEIAADDADVRAVVVGDLRDVGGLHFLVARRGHLERRREIGPQLEAVHAAGRVALGHFLVDDAAAGGHPLDVAGGDGAVVAHAVAVLDGAGEHVGDGLDAAMRMPGEAGEVVLGDVVAEVVEQEERIEVGGVAEAEGAAEMDAGAFEGGLGFDKPLDGSNGHGASLVCRAFDAVGRRLDAAVAGDDLILTCEIAACDSSRADGRVHNPRVSRLYNFEQTPGRLPS